MKPSIESLRDTLNQSIQSGSVEGVIETLQDLMRATQYEPSLSRQSAQEFLDIVANASRVIEALDHNNYLIMSLLLSAIGGQKAFENKLLYLPPATRGHVQKKHRA
jgi:hypothetical protein